MPWKPRTSMLVGGILGACLAGLAVHADAQSQRIRYIAFGDSITSGLGTDETCRCTDISCQQLCGYPRRLQNRLNDAGINAGVLNRGLGAERTPEGLTRLDEVLTEGGRFLLLMEGTNDITRRISPETTLANLEEMARKAEFAGLETVHGTLIPRYPPARVDAANVTNAFVAGGLRDLAFNNARQLVDPFEVFSTTPDVFENFYSEIPDDPVGHPNSAGYDLLTEVFFNAWTGVDTVPPTVGTVAPTDGTEGAAPRAPITVRLYDFGVGLDPTASALFVNDQPVSFTGSIGSHSQDLIYQAQSDLPAEVAVRVEGRDLLGNAMSREVSRFTVDDLAPGPCFPDQTTLCIDRNLGDQRFQVTVRWNTAQGGGQEGEARAIPLAPMGLRRGGLFVFFDLQNPEILVKVLDGCTINDRFWVFVAPTTTLGYELRIVDTVAAQLGLPPSEYEFIVSNPDGNEAPPISDVSAFRTCQYSFP